MGTSLVQFKQTLTQMMAKQDLTLPSTVNPDTFRNAAIVAAQTNPSILQCSPESVFTAVRHLAGIGLMPDGREAAIVPFKGRAQAQPMVYGIIKAVKQSGQVRSIRAEVVYENERLHMSDDIVDRTWRHTQASGEPLDPMNRGGVEVAGAYAVAVLKDGTVEFIAMSRQEIEKRRKASPNQKGDTPTGIWADWYEEMAKKTVIRALCKILPMSSEDVSRILDKDPTFQEVPVKDITPPETTQERLERIAREKAAEQQDEAAEAVFDGPVYDETLAAPMDEAFSEGADAFDQGKAEADNPYEENPEYSSWLYGWRQAQKAHKTGGEA